MIASHLLTLSLLLAGFWTATANRSYKNHRLVEFIPATRAERLNFARLQDHPDAPLLLQSTVQPGASWLAIVSPQQWSSFKRSLQPGSAYRVVFNDMQSAIAASDKQQRIAPQSVDFKAYQDLVTMNAWVDRLKADNPKQVAVVEIGRSFENRPLRLVQVPLSAPGAPAKRKVFIECGTHAREWISPAVCTYIMNALLHSNDPLIKAMADANEFHIAYMSNPDGYEYTRTTNRMWRKTRSRWAGSKCIGTDANRNYGYHWNTTGTSSDPCSDIYAGPAAFSEPESRSVANYLSDRRGQFRAYFSMHSFSQLCMYPFGWTSQRPGNYIDLQAICEAGARGMAKPNNTQYTSGQIYEIVYPASGSSVDEAYAQGIPVPIAIELPPTASDAKGFEMSASRIPQTGDETLYALDEMLREMDRRGY